VISLILSLLIARWLQALLFNPGGFRSEFVDLRLHPGVAYATLACLAVGIMDAGVWSEAAWNLSLVVFMLSTLGGFAIVHALLGSKRFWIVGVYFALVFAPQFLIPPVALLSLSDPWLNWRKLSKRP
jgi:hypothetical protein